MAIIDTVIYSRAPEHARNLIDRKSGRSNNARSAA
jgi:hypothetical protein